MNSGPLSDRIMVGVPWIANNFSSVRATNFAFILCSTSTSMHRRVNSSTTVRIRIFRPVSVRSSTKSYAHT